MERLVAFWLGGEASCRTIDAIQMAAAAVMVTHISQNSRMLWWRVAHERICSEKDTSSRSIICV
jgi:hypothetical protein